MCCVALVSYVDVNVHMCLCTRVFIYCHSHGACISFHIRTVVLGGEGGNARETMILEDGKNALLIIGVPLPGKIFGESVGQRGQHYRQRPRC